MPLGIKAGRGPGDFVFDGDPAPSEKRAQPPPNFWPKSIVAIRSGWIKVPLGMEVNLGRGDVVLDGVAARSR